MLSIDPINIQFQCRYKKEISYEDISSSNFDTDDVQIDIYFQIFDKLLRNFILFFKDFNGRSTRKEYLQMILLKSKEKMMRNACGRDQF